MRSRVLDGGIRDSWLRANRFSQTCFGNGAAAKRAVTQPGLLKEAWGNTLLDQLPTSGFR